MYDVNPLLLQQYPLMKCKLTNTIYPELYEYIAWTVCLVNFPAVRALYNLYTEKLTMSES